MPERQRFIRGMVSWVGFRQEPILYDRDARFAGETKYPFSKLLALAVDGILSSSAKPLRFALPVGVAAISLSVVLELYALMSLLFVSKTPQGWASTMAAIAFFGGFQLVVLGILGEYLGRIHEQTRGRPMFLVEIRISHDRGTARQRPQINRAGSLYLSCNGRIISYNPLINHPLLWHAKCLLLICPAATVNKRTSLSVSSMAARHK